MAKALDDVLPELNHDPAAGWSLGEPMPLPSPELDATPETIEAADLPPERVRFSAPLTLHADDVARDLSGAIVNLSTTGIAALLDGELVSGQRVYCRFRLQLADEPMCVACEVVWRRVGEGGAKLFGLRFLDLLPDEEAKLDAVVRERAFGRAGEWPLPIMPAAPIVTAPSGPSPYLTAVAGLAIGAVIALGMSMVPSVVFSSPRAHPSDPVFAGAAQAAEKPVAGITVLETNVTPPPAKEPALVGLVPAPAVAEAPAVDASAAEAPVAEALALDAAASEANEATADGVLTPHATDDGIELTLLADGNVGEYKTFWLDSPRRLVVDLPGRKSGFSAHSYAIQSALASRLRAGAHSDKVRFVIETSDAVDREVAARPDGHALVVHLRAQR